MVFSIDEQWVTDLVEVQSLSKYNKGNRYILTVIDVFSKYAWVEPVKSKSGVAVTEAFRKILKRSERRKPQTLQTDDGKEFYNQKFAALLKEYGIHHFSTKGDTKASVVERFNRTLKERMYRYFTSVNTLSYVPVLQSLVKGYNVSYHRSIGMVPKKNEREVWNRLYDKRTTNSTKRKGYARVKFVVGDRVRLNKKSKKGYLEKLPGWTEEVFAISRVIPGLVTTYKIKEIDDTPIGGTFYAHDLQKVTVPDDDLFRIEKVVKREGDKLLVRWKGWPDKYDSWIEKKDVKKST